MSTLPPSVLSIDISKDFLDTDTWPKPWVKRWNNDAQGIAGIVAEAKRRKAFVVFEATSVYDRAVMAGQDAAGLAYHRANPRKARDFARSSGFLAKTDRMDAAMLAQYGRSVALRSSEPVAPERQALRALIDRRDQLVTIRKQERTRRHQIADGTIGEEISAHIATLTAANRTLRREDPSAPKSPSAPSQKRTASVVRAMRGTCHRRQPSCLSS